MNKIKSLACKNVIISGRLTKVDHINVKTKKGPMVLKKLIIEVQEKDEIKEVYANYWGPYNFKGNEEGHFIGNLTYKKIKSNKATKKDGSQFEYGIWEIDLRVYAGTYSALTTWVKNMYKEWTCFEAEEEEEDTPTLDDIFSMEDDSEDF